MHERYFDFLILFIVHCSRFSFGLFKIQNQLENVKINQKYLSKGFPLKGKENSRRRQEKSASQ